MLLCQRGWEANEITHPLRDQVILPTGCTRKLPLS